MKFFDRGFVRQLRRRVRKEIKTRPEWRKAARQRPRAGRRQIEERHVRWMAPLVLVGMMAAGEGGSFQWKVLGFYALGITLFRTSQIQRLCSGLEGLHAFVQYPVSTSQMWDHIAGQVFRSSLWWAVDLLFVLLYSMWQAHASWVGWLAIVPLVFVGWASVLGTAIILYCRFPRARFQTFQGFFWLAFSVMIMMAKRDNYRPSEFSLLQHLGDTIMWMSPSGWAVQIAEWSVRGGQPFPVIAGGLLAFVLAYAVPCLHAVAERFVFWQPDEKPLTQVAYEPTEPSSEESSGQTPWAPARDPRASEIEERVLEGDFLRPSLWQRQGWLDRSILHFCRSQEAIADYLLGNSQPFTGNYIKGALIVLVVFLLTKLGVVDRDHQWIYGLGFFLGLVFMTPLLGGRWPGFALGPMRPRFVAFLALLPVGVQDLRRCFLRINALRFLAALPWWLLAGYAFSTLEHEPPLGYLRYVALLWFTLLLFQPFFFVFKISSGTNDSNSGCFNLLAFVTLTVIPLIIAVFTHVVVSVNRLPWYWQVCSLFALGISTFGFEWLYRWMYCRGRFDLLAQSRHRR